MPNRILRDGILDSKRIARLSDPAKVFYYKLFSVVDDYGRFEADPEYLRIRLYPWEQAQVSVDQIRTLLAECGAGNDALILLYAVGRKDYLQITNFKQQCRSKSKFDPPPGVTDPPIKRGKANTSPDNDVSQNTNAQHVIASDSQCAHMQTGPTRLDSTRIVSSLRTSSDLDVDPGYDLWFGAVWMRHPKKSGRKEAFRTSQSVYRSPPKKALIDRNHPLWCMTVNWRKEDGRFAPPLAEWVDNEGFVSGPTGTEVQLEKYGIPAGQIE